MKIHVKKKLHPVLSKLTSGIKSLQVYNINGYEQEEDVIDCPSTDVSLESAKKISRTGAMVEGYEVWFEVQDTDLSNPIPDGVSWKSESAAPPLIWSDLPIFRQGTSSSIRYWQEANNGEFNVNDVELIRESGVIVYNKNGVIKRKSQPDFENTNIETIEYVNENWSFAYFDMIDAHITMKAIFEAKGEDDTERWAECSDVEKSILMEWNIATLELAETFAEPSWSNERKYKEFWSRYRTVNMNMIDALEKRFQDWYGFLNMLFTDNGLKEFEKTWDWGYKEEYVHKYLRVAEVPQVNALVDYSTTVLSTYTKGEIGGDLSIPDIVSYLDGILTSNEYYI